MAMWPFCRNAASPRWHGRRWAAARLLAEPSDGVAARAWTQIGRPTWHRCGRRRRGLASGATRPGSCRLWAPTTCRPHRQRIGRAGCDRWTARHGSNFTRRPGTRGRLNGSAWTASDADASTSARTRTTRARFATPWAASRPASPLSPCERPTGRWASPPTALPACRWTRRWCCGRPPNPRSAFGICHGRSTYAIHVLGADQTDLLRRFIRGGTALRRRVDWHRNASKACRSSPGALARFECDQHATHDGGDHLIVVGRVLRCAIAERRATGVYARPVRQAFRAD